MTKLRNLPILEVSTFAVVCMACALAVVPDADERVLGWIADLNKLSVESSPTVLAESEPPFVPEGMAKPRLSGHNQVASRATAPTGKTQHEFTAGNEEGAFKLEELNDIDANSTQVSADGLQNEVNDDSLSAMDPIETDMLEEFALPDSIDSEREPETWEFKDLPLTDTSPQPIQSPIKHQHTEAIPIFRSLPPLVRVAGKNESATSTSPSQQKMPNAGLEIPSRQRMSPPSKSFDNDFSPIRK